MVRGGSRPFHALHRDLDLAVENVNDFSHKLDLPRRECSCDALEQRVDLERQAIHTSLVGRLILIRVEGVFALEFAEKHKYIRVDVSYIPFFLKLRPPACPKGLFI
ncbi:MAG: hypothetical protein RBG13Loki_2848 [Promethearchaeota archaeon CR_4]|nr:MAG: hypothetical protein RBG13Loki_2848 [Candidatus Lokiarchaeota archaeon CR_4]